MLVEHSVGSNTNNAWTPPLAVHSRHVTTKPLWWWGGWVHWIVFMTSLYMYYALCFVHVEHSVYIMLFLVCWDLTTLCFLSPHSSSVFFILVPQVVTWALFGFFHARNMQSFMGVSKFNSCHKIIMRMNRTACSVKTMHILHICM